MFCTTNTNTLGPGCPIEEEKALSIFQNQPGMNYAQWAEGWSLCGNSPLKMPTCKVRLVGVVTFHALPLRKRC